MPGGALATPGGAGIHLDGPGLFFASLTLRTI
jgi:hypothetical protein